MDSGLLWQKFFVEEMTMMLNVVLYNENSVINIAKKAKKYLSKQEHFRTTNDTIWTNNLYLKFSPNLITVNAFQPNLVTKQDISDCLLYILGGEEIFISNNQQENAYIEKVDHTTKFEDFLVLKGI